MSVCESCRRSVCTTDRKYTHTFGVCKIFQSESGLSPLQWAPWRCGAMAIMPTVWTFRMRLIWRSTLSDLGGRMRFCAKNTRTLPPSSGTCCHCVCSGYSLPCGLKRKKAEHFVRLFACLAEREVTELQSAIIWLLVICMSNSRARSHLGDNGDDYSPSQM